ncbi:repetitive proline-rich cell wall protein 1-like [Hyposmocoma kahamanoa]|uniref:repetitive proline-rich cell wall protein 1-like n=1 Tax=Hyposmocoma kahamanoa TaxID=1477025 RepID=UPI000E6D7264|nr:repetitive proline-rich cell wall protein 1-like [Hyposmocoma kahamanoa]
MKALILTVLLAAATAVPVPEPNSDPVEVIVNGVPKGHGLDVDNILRIDVQKQIDGEIVAVDNPLHPFSTAGIIEAAIAAEANKPVVPDPVIVQPESVPPEIIPQPIVLPEIVGPAIIPKPVILPEPIQPEVVPVVLPEPVKPEVVPESVVLPQPVKPVVLPEPVVLPPSPGPEVVSPVDPDIIVLPDEFTPTEVLPVPSGVIYNDGIVDVTVNGPSDYNIMGTLQNWFDVIVNYLTNGTQQESIKQIM